MANFLEKIDINVRRNISFIVLGILAANHIYFFKPVLSRLLNYPVIGMFDVGTFAGIIGCIAVYLIYKRRM